MEAISKDTAFNKWIVLQCVALCCSALHSVAVRCNALHCVALCCTVLQRVAVHYMSELKMEAISKDTAQSIAVCHTRSSCAILACCSVLWCVAVCCSMLQCVAGR